MNNIYEENGVWKTNISDWEIVDTSDFDNTRYDYQIQNWDKENYKYNIWIKTSMQNNYYLSTYKNFIGKITVGSFDLENKFSHRVELEDDGIIDIRTDGTDGTITGLHIERKKVS